MQRALTNRKDDYNCIASGWEGVSVSLCAFFDFHAMSDWLGVATSEHFIRRKANPLVLVYPTTGDGIRCLGVFRHAWGLHILRVGRTIARMNELYADDIMSFCS